MGLVISEVNLALANCKEVISLRLSQRISIKSGKDIFIALIKVSAVGYHKTVLGIRGNGGEAASCTNEVVSELALADTPR